MENVAKHSPFLYLTIKVLQNKTECAQSLKTGFFQHFLSTRFLPILHHNFSSEIHLLGKFKR